MSASLPALLTAAALLAALLAALATWRMILLAGFLLAALLLAALLLPALLLPALLLPALAARSVQGQPSRSAPGGQSGGLGTPNLPVGKLVRGILHEYPLARPYRFWTLVHPIGPATMLPSDDYSNAPHYQAVKTIAKMDFVRICPPSCTNAPCDIAAERKTADGSQHHPGAG